MKQKPLVISSAVFLLLAFIAGALYYKSQKSTAAVEAYRHDRSTFVRDYSPTHGNADAKVEIVEFFDPACDTCKEFYPMVKKLMDDHPGKIRLYERYAPFHNGSESVVKLLAAANMQGKFWETLDAVFAAQVELGAAAPAAAGTGMELYRRRGSGHQAAQAGHEFARNGQDRPAGSCGRAKAEREGDTGVLRRRQAAAELGLGATEESGAGRTRCRLLGFSPRIEAYYADKRGLTCIKTRSKEQVQCVRDVWPTNGKTR